MVRRVVGAVLVVTALVVGLNLTDGLQRAVPGYTDALQSHIEANAIGQAGLAGVTGTRSTGDLATCTDASPVLQQCGTAPAIAGISHWLQHPGGPAAHRRRPEGPGGPARLLDVLVHQLPAHAAPRRGLEPRLRHGRSDRHRRPHPRVRLRARDLQRGPGGGSSSGCTTRSPMDNGYATWNTYGNQYWPAEYLIDATGTVRHVDFGEGQYAQTESFIRQLLVAADPTVHPAAGHRRARPDPRRSRPRPESYLGYQHGDAESGGADGGRGPDDPVCGSRPTCPRTTYAYGGNWSIGQRGVHRRDRGHPGAPLPGPGRLPGARGDGHGPGHGRRAGDPDGDGERRAQALPAGRGRTPPSRRCSP